MNRHSSVSSTWFRFAGTSIVSAVCMGFGFVYFFISCGRADWESKLVGSWVVNVKQTTVTFTFAHDHTYVRAVRGATTNVQTGSWSIDGRRLICTVPPTGYETNSIKTLTDSLLILRGRDRNGEEYERTLARDK